jgi:hypothetical protein
MTRFCTAAYVFISLTFRACIPAQYVANLRDLDPFGDVIIHSDRPTFFAAFRHRAGQSQLSTGRSQSGTVYSLIKTPEKQDVFESTAVISAEGCWRVRSLNIGSYLGIEKTHEGWNIDAINANRPTAMIHDTDTQTPPAQT